MTQFRAGESIAACLDRWASERAQDEAICFVDGPTWCWAQLRDRVEGQVRALQALGVGPGDPVLCGLPNGPLATLTLLACARLGAVFVPFNIAYRGALLQHVLDNAGARVLLAHGQLLERLGECDLGALQTLVVLGPERLGRPGLQQIDAEALPALAAAAGTGGVAAAVEPWHTLMIIYTSGTTGPSKGVLCSHRHAHAAALGFRNVGPGDRNLTALPIFHVGGVLGVLWAIFHGGSVVIAERFRTAEFWSIVRRHRVTTTGLLGSMVDFLMAQPPGEDEAAHGLRSVLVAPYGQAAIDFGRRFRVPVYTEFNMSELAVPLFAGPDPGVPGTCGLPVPGVELRLVDEHEQPVAAGTVGELVLRMQEPWTISHGYHGDAAATAQAWRHGWFHTGDLFRIDAAGHYHFVDRAKDAIRRRGENISSFEVEAALLQHPDVAQAAVVGVPAAAGGEQEVLAVVQWTEGSVADPVALLAALAADLPHFMLPRYVRSVSDMPRTPTQKIEKHRLRAEGLVPGTWDREAAGITVRAPRWEPRG